MDAVLGQQVRHARREAHKTLRGLAKEASISPALLSLIEQDKHVPPPDVLVRLAVALGRDADYWCGLAGRITPQAEASLARLAKDYPELFRYLRTMVERKGAQ